MWCHEFLAPSYAANVGIMNFFGIVSSRILLVKGENVSIIGLILSLAPSSISNCSFIFSNYWSTLTSSFLHLFSLWYWFLPYFSPLPLFQAHMRLSSTSFSMWSHTALLRGRTIGSLPFLISSFSSPALMLLCDGLYSSWWAEVRCR